MNNNNDNCNTNWFIHWITKGGVVLGKSIDSCHKVLSPGRLKEYLTFHLKNDELRMTGFIHGMEDYLGSNEYLNWLLMLKPCETVSESKNNKKDKILGKYTNANGNKNRNKNTSRNGTGQPSGLNSNSLYGFGMGLTQNVGIINKENNIYNNNYGSSRYANYGGNLTQAAASLLPKLDRQSKRDIGDSLMSFLLNIECLQSKIVEILFDKMTLDLSDYDDNDEIGNNEKMENELGHNVHPCDISRAIVVNISKINDIVNISEFTEKLMELLETSRSVEIQKQMIDAIPDIIRDRQHSVMSLF